MTGGTWHRQHIANTPQKLDLVQSTLLKLTENFEFELLAWAVFSNHYHMVIQHHGERNDDLAQLMRHLHGTLSRQLNQMDGISGRRCFYQFWDTTISDEVSLFARMNYVMQNPVKHGLAATASQYPWCSESWFLAKQGSAKYGTVKSFPTDEVNVYDDFEPLVVPSEAKHDPA